MKKCIKCQVTITKKIRQGKRKNSMYLFLCCLYDNIFDHNKTELKLILGNNCKTGALFKCENLIWLITKFIIRTSCRSWWHHSHFPSVLHRPNRSGLQPQHGELRAAQPAGAAAVPLQADGGANHLPHLHRQPHQTGLPVRARLLHRVQRRAEDLPHLPTDHSRADSAVRMKTSRALGHCTTEPLRYYVEFTGCSSFSCSSLEQN